MGYSKDCFSEQTYAGQNTPYKQPSIGPNVVHFGERSKCPSERLFCWLKIEKMTSISSEGLFKRAGLSTRCLLCGTARKPLLTFKAEAATSIGRSFRCRHCCC